MERSTPYRIPVKVLPAHLSRREDWDANASDSETEPEDAERRTAIWVRQRPNRGSGSGGARRQQADYLKVEKKVTEVVYNNTKKKAKGRGGRTKRVRGTRVVPRVFNRLTSTAVNLSGDATTIHDVIPRQRFRDGKWVAEPNFGATTVVCVLLLRAGSARKYCFTNLEQQAPVNLRAKAEELGYHVVNAPKAHAEAELVMYQEAYKGTTLLGIGCDKPHCQECARVLWDYQESGVVPTDTTVSQDIFQKYEMPPLLQEITGKEDRPSEWDDFVKRDYPPKPEDI